MLVVKIEEKFFEKMIRNSYYIKGHYFKKIINKTFELVTHSNAIR